MQTTPDDIIYYICRHKSPEDRCTGEVLCIWLRDGWLFRPFWHAPDSFAESDWSPSPRVPRLRDGNNIHALPKRFLIDRSAQTERVFRRKSLPSFVKSPGVLKEGP